MKITQEILQSYARLIVRSGAILADVWTDAKMPVVDNLGEDFLAYVKDGMQISVSESGLVTVD